MEGDSVTLHTHLTEIQRDEQIEWMFGPQDTLIARIYKVFNKVSIFDDVLDGMFRDRLEVDSQTGSLTITNVTTQHSGLYEMTISGRQETSYTHSVTVYEVKSVSVMEGDTVTLHTHLTDIQRDEQIEWMFGPQDTLIARNVEVFNKVSVYDGVHDGMFRDRLQVDDQNGSLTITNITTQHSGLYRMTIGNATGISYTFSVVVYCE
ncbi:hypothetical protein E1301_Tti013508 [Triplophysa tibetana]|uniref:Immunoglobulin domain-containing protein n=1 Tax=Triplophysa tibetana TaxID=1572043 RepID=A0A5A9NSM4_9TELE|nr:hypothetical protein E1301_Tti013508 [Triplophysa tibetana]